VFPRPLRLESVEKWLIGQPAEAAVFNEAGRRAAGEMLAVSGERPSMIYKEPAVSRTVQKTLATAWQRAAADRETDR
jgi:CO/xanthine dehydrogenase FAD-binding subunit